MPEMILGLDIGSESVKAVLSTPKSRADIRVLAQSIVRFEGTGDLEAVLKKTAETILPQTSSRPSCVVSLPPSDIMFRQIHLPFHDENRIKKTLPFELEPLLPLPVEEVVADYVPLPTEGLLAAACNRERIRKIIALVETHLGDVAVIDISAAAQALPLLEQKATGGAGLLLDVGASSTVALFYEKNAIVQIRSFAFGGNAITRALAEEASCEIPEAEKIKIDAAYGANAAKAGEACRKFCAELLNTAEFLRLNETLHGAVEQVTLTGGGALFNPLKDQLEKAIGRPVELFDFSRFGQSAIDEKAHGDYSPLIMNGALAAARRAQASRKSFNFRQGEFAARNMLGDFGARWKWAAVVACVIAVLAAVDVGLGYSLQMRQSADLKNQINVLFKKNYPQGNPLTDQVGQLKTKLVSDRKAYGLDGGSGVLVIEMIRDISGLISPDLQIVIYHFHYENNWILLKGEAKKIDDVTSVKNALLKSTVIKNVVVNSTSLGKDGTKVDFDLKLELK